MRQPAGILAPTWTRARGLTARAAVLVLVLAVLVASYARQVSLYLGQQSELRATQAEIAETQRRIDVLQDSVDRWQDPAYVRAQARDRLGWVVPGETSYVVIGPDGKQLVGTTGITSDRSLDRANAMVWWQRAWDTVVTADQPIPSGRNRP